MSSDDARPMTQKDRNDLRLNWVCVGMWAAFVLDAVGWLLGTSTH